MLHVLIQTNDLYFSKTKWVFEEQWILLFSSIWPRNLCFCLHYIYIVWWTSLFCPLEHSISTWWQRNPLLLFWISIPRRRKSWPLGDCRYLIWKMLHGNDDSFYDFILVEIAISCFVERTFFFFNTHFDWSNLFMLLLILLIFCWKKSWFVFSYIVL